MNWYWTHLVRAIGTIHALAESTFRVFPDPYAIHVRFRRYDRCKRTLRADLRCSSTRRMIRDVTAASAMSGPKTRSPRAAATQWRSHLFFALLTAALLALAFPQPGWWLLSFFCLVPLVLLAVRSAQPRTLVWTTWLASLAWWLVMIRWMQPVTGGGYVALCAYLALYWPLSLLLTRHLHRSLGLPLTLALPLSWGSLEIVRGHILAGGFGWYMLGHTLGNWHPSQSASRLVQFADILGEAGVSFLVLLCNGLIADFLHRPWFITHRQRRRFSPVLALCLAFTLGSLVLAWGYGQWRISQTPGLLQRGIRVAVVQTNVPLDNKVSPSFDRLFSDWRRLVDLTITAGTQTPAPQLIVWPETMVPFPLNPEFVQAMTQAGEGLEQYAQFHIQIEQLAMSLKVPLLVGANAEFDFKPYTSPKGYTYPRATRSYNSAYLYTATGRQGDRYDKVHRVPFGEFIPWVDGWPWLKNQVIGNLTPYNEDYTIQAGDRYTVFEIPAGDTQVRFASPICFEDTVARVVRPMVYDPQGNKRTDLLINLTNDGWFSGTHENWQHLQLASFRCIENRTPMARAVNTGVSSFIDSAGRVVAILESHGKSQLVDGYLACDLSRDPRQTLFGTLGSWPNVALTSMTFVLAVLGAARRARQ